MKARALKFGLLAILLAVPAYISADTIVVCTPPFCESDETITVSDISVTTTPDTPLEISLPASITGPYTLSFNVYDENGEENTSSEQGGTVAFAGDQNDQNPATYTPPSGFTGSDSFIYQAKFGPFSATGTVSITVESIDEPETVQIAIRRNSTLIGPIEVELPSESAPDVDLSATGSVETHSIPARSVLALLTSLDTENSDFAITDLAYFSSFSSFIVNCIDVEPSESADCFSWTYAVNGSFPSVGMDSTELSDGDVAYIFFGSAWQVSVSDSSVEENEEFTALIERYDAESGTYVPAEGEVAGAVQFDEFFSFTEFATSTTDANGEATLSLSETGEYSVGAQSVFYFPFASLTVTEPEEEEEEPAPSSGGGGGGGGITHLTFNVPLAIAYISSKQNANGSFENELLTDWAALAFSAYDAGTAKTNLKNYMLSWSPALSSATDYERHAMALMALGIDPYTGAGRDYITPIVSFFDGTQVGDAALATDDIFSLFPLTRAGYSTSDSMIQKIIAFIVAAQQSNGSWTGGVDVTAAAVQALAPHTSQPGVSDALTKAQSYLRSQQQTNGGFSNSFATSWTMQAIAALGQTESQWSGGIGYYPTDYLASLQQTDGGVDPTSTSVTNRVWATEYAVPGALAKTWYSLLTSFARPTSGTTGGTAATSATPTATSTATSTQLIAATSTAPAATTTPTVTTLVIATTTGEVLGVAIENTVPEEIVAAVAKAIEASNVEPAEADEPAIEIPEPVQTAAAAAGVPQKYYFLFALLILLLYGFTWYMVSWRKYWH